MVSPVLQRSEEVLESATAVGCTLVLTDRRLMLVREGTQHRPRTGVQTWTLDRTLTIRRLVVDARERIYSEEAPADPS